jgi:hypothetical protein
MRLKYQFLLKLEQILDFVLQKLEDFIGILKDEIIDYGHWMMLLMNG